MVDENNPISPIFKGSGLLLKLSPTPAVKAKTFANNPDKKQ
ncbi:hypothetical protein SynROS8604_02074 [Synechococcus sp. ROS8604]|nr:hypothetical protein SynROS8604_02074 [Synechococcus sp. ROS8604]